MNADNELEVRLPVKAGTRLVAGGVRRLGAVARARAAARRGCSAAAIGDAPGIDMLYISGPFNGKTPATRRAGSRSSSAGRRPRATRSRARARSSPTLARRAYRRPVTDADVAAAAGDLQAKAARSATSTPASSARSKRCSRRRSSCSASSASRPAPSRGAAYRLSDLELASRLSFFLWKSIPDDELLDAGRARAAEGSGRARRSRCAGCSPTARSTRFLNDFVGPVARGAQHQHAASPIAACSQLRRHAARGDGAGDGALLREPGARGSADPGSAARQLHVPQRAAGAALRHRRRLRQPLPPRDADRRAPLRAARPGQRPDGDVVRRPDVGRAARQVDAREPARRAAAAAAAERAAAQGERRQAASRRRCASGWSSIATTRSARAATRGWIRSASRSSTSTRSAAGARPTAAPRSTRRSRCTAQTIDSPKAFREALLGAGDEFVRTVTEKLLTYALGRGLEYLRRAGGPAARARRWRGNDYRWSSLVLGIVQERAVPDAGACRRRRSRPRPARPSRRQR